MKLAPGAKSWNVDDGWTDDRRPGRPTWANPLNVEPASFVRWVEDDEALDELVNEARATTWTDGVEVALVTLTSGRRMFVRGGRDGITFDVMELAEGFSILIVDHPGESLKVSRIDWHTHPIATGPSDGDREAIRLLGQAESRIFEIGESVTVRASAPIARSLAAVDSARPLDVIDVIEIKASYGLAAAPGIILVLRDFRPSNPQSLVGQIALVRTPIGDHWLAEVEGTRDHGTTVSIHLAGLGPSEIPIGSVVHFPSLAGPVVEKVRSSLAESVGQGGADASAGR